MEEMKMIMEVPSDFKLEKAVCNHGSFMMAPNNWLPSDKTLTRPLRLSHEGDSPSVTASIHHPPNRNYLTITLHHPPHLRISSHHRQFVLSQVARMMRIAPEDDRMLGEFHELHPRAKEAGFGRIFRSPNLFEDIIKSILLCYSSSLEMAEALCHLQRKLFCACNTKAKTKTKTKKRKRCVCVCECKGNFPTPEEIASLDVDTLRRECRLGLRASTIIEFAQNIIQNQNIRLDLDRPSASTYNTLMNINGFGSFVAANVMMCLGFYQHIPIDTETIKHLEHVHCKSGLKRKKVQREVVAEIYDKYAPFQSLAYWMERVEFYEKHFGKLSDLPTSKYRYVTSTKFNPQP